MQLTASHHDGFTDLLLDWSVRIEDGIGIVDAKWFASSGRKNARFELPFPDFDVAEAAFILASLKPLYDGHIDDFPNHILEFTDGHDCVRVSVHVGLGWPTDVQPDIDSFYRIWNPIANLVHSNFNLPKL